LHKHIVKSTKKLTSNIFGSVCYCFSPEKAQSVKTIGKWSTARIAIAQKSGLHKNDNCSTHLDQFSKK
jgi:hypothetical protein